MTRKTRGKFVDPIEREIEAALDPGAFIPDRACFSFVGGLDEVSAGIAKLIASDPSRAAGLYETFLAACYMKIEELDDSSGSFGQFVGELYRGWLQARQAGGADPDETALRLVEWMDDDDYGFCLDLERDLVKVFDRANLAAFVKVVRARFDAAGESVQEPGRSRKDSPDYIRRHFGEILRCLYAARKDVTAYVALAGETGLKAQDCHTIATMLSKRRKPGEALTWVERGIGLDKKTPHGSAARQDLAKLQRELLEKLGRGEEALDAAWAEYREHPSSYTYDGLMKFVPKAKRAEWHEKAMAMVKGADLHSAIDLLEATRENDRLAALIDEASEQALEGLSHYTAERVAKKLEKGRPELAARLWRAQGFRILEAKKSKYYDAALSNFERAKRCFERAGLEKEWQETLSQVRAVHYRKSGFMDGFERLVEGKGTRDTVSFVEEAKARFRERHVRARDREIEQPRKRGK
ncbi:MAG: hypothetical protein IT186_13280 [Acidobacteria bacterium]|nr:hypothetical protein [Acidobacteriota bacterium]